jgi:hypothetical protein
MIGDFLNTNKKKDVKTRKDQIMFCGKKYRQDKKTGYYVCTSGERKRLHVAMWEQKYGVEVPPGCLIHHLDWDKTNNTIENLICVTVAEHERIHNVVGGEAGKALGYELVNSRVAGCPAGIYNEK